nr:MAG TPA: hypothetical protein [Caudoviricetes sp.]
MSEHSVTSYGLNATKSSKKLTRTNCSNLY